VRWNRAYWYPLLRIATWHCQGTIDFEFLSAFTAHPEFT
jgi:hypothetical protein